MASRAIRVGSATLKTIFRPRYAHAYKLPTLILAIKLHAPISKTPHLRPTRCWLPNLRQHGHMAHWDAQAWRLATSGVRYRMLGCRGSDNGSNLKIPTLKVPKCPTP